MTETSTKLSRTEFSDEELDERVLQAIRVRGGRVTEADLTVESGIPPHLLGPSLRRTLTVYDSSIEVNEHGDVVYVFDPKLARRDDGSRRWREIGRKAWAAFRVFYKIAIATVLIVYFVLFVILVVAALVALMSQRKGSSGGGWSSSSSSSSSSSGLGDFFLWVWIFGDNDHRHHRRTYGSSHRSSRQQSYGLMGASPSAPVPYDAGWAGHDPVKDGRPFYEKVFSFVFGREEQEHDELFTEKELLAYIRSQSGVVSPSELASRTGWSIRAAEKESTRLIAQYGGDVHVTPSGEMLYVFPDLLATAGGAISVETAPAPAIWTRYENPLPVTGNTGGANFLIVFLNAFVLLGASVLIPSFAAPVLDIDLTTSAMHVGLYVIPFVYSGLFFAVPILRWLFHVVPENRRRARHNTRRALFRHVYDWSLRSEDFLPASSATLALEGLPMNVRLSATDPENLAKQLGELAFEFEAESKLGDDGQVNYQFARITSEHVAALAARRSDTPLALLHIGQNELAARN